MSKRVGSAAAVAVLAAAYLVGFVEPAGAQAGERIVSYDVVMTVERSGDVAVQETIAYDFGASERHGIYRDIPVRARFDDRYDRVYPLHVESVTAEPAGTSARYEETDEAGNRRIRVGDPDTTITGLHTYVISYRIEGALNAFEDHDELYWNPIGHEWQVPIGGASVQVHVPGGPVRASCFIGPLGSGLPCASTRITEDVPGPGFASFSHSELAPYSGFTVVVGFPTGLVPHPEPRLEERWNAARAFSVTPASVGGSFAILVFGMGFVIRSAWRGGRDRRFIGSPVDAAFGTADGAHQAVPLFDHSLHPVEFEPPEKIRPGEMGTLLDEAVNPVDVSATIIDLAVRGYLTIEDIPKKGIFGRNDWRLTKLKGGGDLADYESKLLSGLFKSGDDVELSTLKHSFVDEMRSVREALYTRAVDAGWFRGNPESIRKKWKAIAGGVFAAGAAVTVALASVTTFGLLGTPVIAVGVALWVVAGRMPSRTPKGTGMLGRVTGFRRLFDGGEDQRAHFSERANLFTEYLPYAIAFGCVDKWAGVFEGLGAEVPAPSWYTSTRTFSVMHLADDMDDFSTSAAGAVGALSRSASGGSGFSGGGSGGGGGGGGGGSW